MSLRAWLGRRDAAGRRVCRTPAALALAAPAGLWLGRLIYASDMGSLCAALTLIPLLTAGLFLLAARWRLALMLILSAATAVGLFAEAQRFNAWSGVPLRPNPAGYFLTDWVFCFTVSLAGAGAAWLLKVCWVSPRRDRVGRGLCLACGYDLRGSPGACPECGAAGRPEPPAASE